MRPIHAVFAHAAALHPVFEALGLCLGFQAYRVLKRREADPVGGPARFWLLVAAAVGASAGSRATAALESLASLKSLADTPSTALCHSGKSIVGALVCGLFAVELAKRALGVRRRSGDLFTYPTILGLIIGRVGCFLGGLEDCTFGVATAGPFAVDFGDGIGRHPAQLYEIAFLAALGAGLAAYDRRKGFADGGRFRAFLVAYLLFRLAADAFKPLIPLTPGGFAATQILCLVGLAWYLAPSLSSHFAARFSPCPQPHATTSSTTPR